MIALGRPHRAGLWFEWMATPAARVESRVSGQIVAAGSAAAAVDYGMPGMLVTASNQHFESVNNVPALGSKDLTLIWRGKFFGTQSNFAYVFGLSDFPTVAASHLFLLYRNGTNPDLITIATNTGIDASAGSDANAGLSSHYNKEIVIGVSNIAGTGNYSWIVLADGAIIYADVVSGGTSGATRYTTSGDKIRLHQSSAAMNGMTSGAWLLNRAMPLAEMFQAGRGLLKPRDRVSPLLLAMDGALPTPSLLVKIQQYGAFV